jgi:flavin reductase (DIM6/NTAB) family NADH-FMN oxidoreductase RutF/DNA-binding GntR family transcriptional regulator
LIASEPPRFYGRGRSGTTDQNGGDRVDAVGQTAAQTIAAFDSAVFRQVIGNFMSGVVVITTRHDGVDHGMTVSAISSLSLEPPLLLVCLNVNSGTQEAVRRAGAFGVNILAEHQGDLADRFARSGPDKFAGIGVREGRIGVPLLADTLAIVECRVVEIVTAGTHRVFLSQVVHAEAGQGSPLAYFQGRFGRFELAQDADVYQQVRQLVLTRKMGPNQSLDVQRLSARLNVSPSAAYYALTRLVGEKLVMRDAERGHVVAPLDAAASDDAHDAKLAMELGAADLTVGRLTAGQLAEFRGLAEATAPLIHAGHITDVPAYIEANMRFHSYPVEATGIAALAAAYQQLSIPELMTRALSGEVAAGPELIEDHRRLVDAYERADLDEVKRIVREHNERAKATQRAGIERAGGQL